MVDIGLENLENLGVVGGWFLAFKLCLRDLIQSGGDTQVLVLPGIVFLECGILGDRLVARVGCDVDWGFLRLRLAV